LRSVRWIPDARSWKSTGIEPNKCHDGLPAYPDVVHRMLSWRENRAGNHYSDSFVPSRQQLPCAYQHGHFFEWDKMYAFWGSVPQKEREAVLGLPDPEFREFQPQLVFLKNGRVVYLESEPLDVENPIKDEVVFESSSGTGIRMFTPSSLFSFEEESGPDGRYYVLKRVQ
jgi:hypothetical protein